MTAARILELRSVRGTGGGPEKTILLGAARADPRRFAITVCYLRDERDGVFSVGARAAPLGLDYIEVRERHSWDVSILSSLRRICRERAIEIVHSHEYKTDLLALLLSWLEGVTPLATVHGWSGRSRRERLYYAADRRLLALFPRLVAVSGEIRGALLRAGVKPGRILTLPNGIDHRELRRDAAAVPALRASLGIAPGTRVVGSIGRLAREKRLDVLLRAFALLRTSWKGDLALLLAGDGDERHALAREASILGIGEACRFLGHRDDVAALHHAFDVFVQSSENEGTPNAVLEAMAMETPIVATDAGGTRELVTDGVHGLIVRPRDARALAHAVERCLADPLSARHRAIAARARVEGTLSFDARMASLERVYDELIETRRRPLRPSGPAHGGAASGEQGAANAPAPCFPGTLLAVHRSRIEPAGSDISVQHARGD